MKKIVLLGLIVLFSLFAFGVYAQTNNISNSGENNVSRVEHLVVEKTPAFIKDAMQITAECLEDFRTGALSAVQVREQKISKDLKVLDAEDKKDPVEILETGETIKIDPIARAFKTVQLFLLKLIEGVFASRVAFYGISLLIIIIILRYILD